MLSKFRYSIWLLLPLLLPAQERSDLQQILDRLDRLERENHNLADEVRALRSELAGSRAPAAAPSQETYVSEIPVDERTTVLERRTEELSQSKVESGQRLPVTFTGMVLFNAFLNGRANGGFQAPFVAAPLDNLTNGGAGLSQSIIGLRFNGPRVFGGGQVHGSIDMDLWGGTSASLNHLLRMRVATVQVDWKNSSLTAGQDKPLIAPRDPDSLSQVAFSPLTDAGNLWLWQPQVRFEQRFALGENTGIRAQAAVYQTSETATSVPSEYQSTLAGARPALQGRFELWRRFSSGARAEIAPGFDVSQTQVGGVSLPSRLFTLDWMIQPLARFRFMGAFFNGTNAAGLGGLRQGFTLLAGIRFTPVPTTGGWTQLSYFATRRLTFNVYGGQESDRASYLLNGQISKNFAYAGNLQYRLGSNVLLGLEANQVRTTYVGSVLRLVNHYDLALAYLF